jgi:hypothetical protein
MYIFGDLMNRSASARTDDIQKKIDGNPFICFNERNYISDAVPSSG